MKNPFKTLGTRTVYENKWITVREDRVIHPDTGEGVYSVVETNDSVMIGAVNDKGEVFLVHSFSYPAQKWHWELPAGGSDGEDIVTASKRELAEEAGIAAESWTKLPATRVCDGLMTERTHTLLAQTLTHIPRPAADDTGLIDDGRFFSFAEVHTMIANGQIDEGQTITAFYFIERAVNKRKK